MTARRVLPSLLPVLDVMQGRVVWGIAGERASYRSLQTPLTTGSRPVDVARGLRRLVGHNWLYLADLNALQFDQPQWETVRQLVDDGYQLLVDAGTRDSARAEQLATTGVSKMIVALESLDCRESLREIIDRIGESQTLFSLDLKRGTPLGSPLVTQSEEPSAIAAWAVDKGVDGLIVLDIASVGGEEGVPTAKLCRNLRADHPNITLISGGGVRTVDDVQCLRESGVDSVLIASALHRQTIGPAEIMSMTVR